MVVTGIKPAQWMMALGVGMAMVLGGCSAALGPNPISAMRSSKGVRPGGHTAIAVPETGMVIGASWGRMEPLREATHRSWNKMRVTYVNDAVKHNPVYMRDLDAGSHFAEGRAAVKQDVVSPVEIPWFYLNLTVTPVLMCIQPPLATVCTVPRGISPIYKGYLPPHGAIAPAATSGPFHWPYPVVHVSGAAMPQH